MESSIKHINNGFLLNKELYLDTIRFWDKRVLNALRNNKNEYKKWLNTSDSNGGLVMDGNPIYSLINKDSSKALRIVQDEPRSRKPYMHAWTEVFDKGEEGQNIPVLVIALVLSNQTLKESLSLIHQWFEEYHTDKFIELLGVTNKKFENNYVPSDKEVAWELHENLNRLNKYLAPIYSNKKRKMSGKRFSVSKFQQLNKKIGQLSKDYDFGHQQEQESPSTLKNK